MEGRVSGGTFTAEGTQIGGLSAPDGAVTLGFRAEDAFLASDTTGQINSRVYTQELLGDATMASVRIGGALVSVKADKLFRTKIDDPISISVPTKHCHLFDQETGARIGV